MRRRALASVSSPRQMQVDRDRGVVAVRDRPDDVLRAERGVAAEEHVRAASTPSSPCRRPACPTRRTRGRCRARSTGTHFPGRSRPARRRTGSGRRARRSARAGAGPCASRCARDLLERDAGQLAVVVRERLRHEVVVDRDALVHRVFLLPRRRLHLVEAGAHDHLHVLAAQPPRAAAAVHRRVAAAQHDDALADLRRVAERHATTASRCRCGCWPRLRARPGNVEVAPARRAAADEHRVAAFGEQRAAGCRCAARRGTRRRGRGCSPPPRRSRCRAAGTSGICVRIMPPACGVAVEHDALVAERREIARDGQRRRARRRRARCACRSCVVAGLRQARRGCLPCSRRRRASAGRSRPARAWRRSCDAPASPPRRGRGGTRARTDDRRCGRECPGRRSTSS